MLMFCSYFSDILNISRPLDIILKTSPCKFLQSLQSTIEKATLIKGHVAQILLKRFSFRLYS